MIKPNLSICIATKNRAKYAAHSVKSILKSKRDDFEIVLQDNSDEPEDLKCLINDISDDRLKYFYVPPPLSSIDNFRLTIKNSIGKYVCLIGDDDAVLPDLFVALDFAIYNDVDCVVGSLSLNYRWPGTGIKKTLFTDTTVGGLSIVGYDTKSYVIRPLDSIKKLMRNGGTHYLKYKFPKFYHGLVKKSLFEEIKEKTGNFIGGLSPDIYTSTALALLAKKTVVVNHPLTMPGVCAASTSVTEGNFKSVGNSFSDAPHLRERGFYSRSNLVPDVYCLETIWADSCLAALNDLGQQKYIKEFSVPKLMAYIHLEHPELKGRVYKYYKSNTSFLYWNILIVKHLALMISVFLELRVARIYNRILILVGLRKLKNIYNLDNIEDAVESYELLVNSNNKRLLLNKNLKKAVSGNYA